MQPISGLAVLIPDTNPIYITKGTLDFQYPFFTVACGAHRHSFPLMEENHV